MSKLIFSFYHLLSLFILPILIVIIGFKFDTKLSVDLSIVHSVVFMVFFPFNGNARHYILNSQDTRFIGNLICFRLLSYIPLFLTAGLISFLVLDVSFYYILIILSLGSFYWINEIFVSIVEKEKRFSLVILLIFLFILLLLNTVFNNEKIINYSFILLIVCLSLIIVLIKIWKACNFRLNLYELRKDFVEKIIPQIGGTFIIGISSFIFKFIILTLTPKSMAGSIFIAFTLSGAILTIFSYGLGPSFIASEVTNKDKRVLKYIKKLFFIPVLIGILTIFCEYFDIINFKFIDNQTVFLFCFGMSLIGVPISILGQYYKLSVLHMNLKLKVYLYDSIPNISILIITICVLFFLEPYFLGLTYIYTGFVTYIIYKRIYLSL